jgi:hypothetical protein
VIINQVFENPKILWEILTSGIDIVGPWVPAVNKKQRYGKESEWRTKVDGEPCIIVCKSMWLIEPQIIDYAYELTVYDYNDDEIDYNEEAYEDALKKYNIKLSEWKDWSVYYKNIIRYAETKELAKDMAEKILVEDNILFV